MFVYTEICARLFIIYTYNFGQRDRRIDVELDAEIVTA